MTAPVGDAAESSQRDGPPLWSQRNNFSDGKCRAGEMTCCLDPGAECCTICSRLRYTVQELDMPALENRGRREIGDHVMPMSAHPPAVNHSGRVAAGSSR